MEKILLVGLGGFIGSIFRYLLSGYVQQASRSASFPHGTLVVNILGCFIIGLLTYLAESRGLFTDESRAFVFVGVLGGFTTFSTFGNETMNLLRDGESFLASVNIAAHVLLGLLFVWIGLKTAYLIWR
ncbi:MAG: hypothetical protein A2X59_05675 [Nitrospirae bacterium GWC2_42_7]|nr:MAG: hypothetical protein A2X59_05675 [Nitrospirae bacterium GWC2_42_7]